MATYSNARLDAQSGEALGARIAQDLDLAGVFRRLVEATDAEGGIRPWAEARGLHPSIIDHFLRGQRGPSPQLLQALGLRKVTMYQVEHDLDQL